MITEEHLNHWVKEIRYQLGGLHSKLKESDRNENHSLEYIEEKAKTISSLIAQIDYDMENDKIGEL